MNTQVELQLNAQNFDKWLKNSTVEEESKGVYLILTNSYEECIEINTVDFKGWKITAPWNLNSVDEEKVFSMVDDFTEAETEESTYDINEEQGLYGYGY